MQNDRDTVRNFFNQGGTLPALLDLDPVDLDSIYAYACQLFDAGDYAAAKRFCLLLGHRSFGSAPAGFRPDLAEADDESLEIFLGNAD